MKSEQIEVVRGTELSRIPWLQHGFSTRVGGLSIAYGPDELNLGFTKDDDAEAVTGNRAIFLRAVAGEAEVEMLVVRQVHGTRVLRVEAGDSGRLTRDGRAIKEADGLISNAPGVMLAVQAADCVPVLVADTKRRVVAAFHAGWRGTVAGIVERGIAQMASEFGCEAKDMVGAVGPSIGACCYSVGEEVRTQFGAAFGYADELFVQRDGGMYLDLWEANRRQLLAAGLTADAVTVVGECSACTRVGGRRKYFSHRAEQGFTGRAMGMIGIAAG